jgi:acetyl esterase
MTSALTLMAKERGGPRIAAQVLFYPVTDANLDTGSYQRYADGPWATREAMRWFWDSYLPDRARRAEITAAPPRATADQLRGLPPALIIIGEHDVLRDGGVAYARKLSQAGVPVTQVRLGGTIHDLTTTHVKGEPT